ncbi:MAG: DUF434 domain-containing protein [Deltaproteobacteria bacterium]|nr:DUF434 domain-containing protein [Deltaproteobacteria bacterium]
MNVLDIPRAEAVLLRAAEDFRYLLAHGYPRAASLTLVGNRYNLDAAGRHVLHRGVYDPAEAEARKNKLLPPDRIKDRILAVDGHNVVITLESALTGVTLIWADDGLIRDIAGVRGGHTLTPVTEQAVSLLAEAVHSIQPGEILAYFDAPISHSGVLAAMTQERLARLGIRHTSIAVKAPDDEIAAQKEAIAATSDSHLADRVTLLFDLAAHIIFTRLRPLPRSLIRFSTSKNTIDTLISYN